jgi:L-alanine-DL-glutamate epimerase-like enolase superfamily enzyme
MHITAVETIVPRAHPVLLWVRLHTDTGVIGTGETVGQPTAAGEAVHGMMAELLIGEDPRRIDWHWHRLYRALAYHGIGGAELRALSAVEIALWDLLGRLTEQPVYQVLGGLYRERVPIYNTCGSYGEIQDRDRFLNDPGPLARELLDEGIRMMKVWPFDELAVPTDGQHITRSQLDEGVERIAAIRDAVGDEMEIAVEGHSLWNLPSAVRIAKAVEPYNPIWVEDLLWPENPQTLAELRAKTNVPVIASERLLTRWGYRELLERGAADIVMLDPLWAGGLAESRRIATLASVHQRPVAPHNCGGPLGHAAVSHFCASTPNLLVMETIRAFYRGYHPDLVTHVPKIEDGALIPLDGPGLGTELTPQALAGETVHHRVTEHGTGHMAGFAAGDPWRTQRF